MALDKNLHILKLYFSRREYCNISKITGHGKLVNIIYDGMNRR